MDKANTISWVLSVAVVSLLSIAIFGAPDLAKWAAFYVSTDAIPFGLCGVATWLILARIDPNRFMSATLSGNIPIILLFYIFVIPLSIWAIFEIEKYKTKCNQHSNKPE